MKTSGGIRPLIVSVFLCLGVWGPGFAPPALGEEWTREEDIRNPIDFAGRQRMLTQQMALYACFVMAGVERERYISKKESVARQFENYLDALQNGSEVLRLYPEGNAPVLERLQAVSDEWDTLGPAIRQVAAGDLHAVPISQVVTLNLEVLSLSHGAVQAIQTAHLNDAGDKDLAETLDVAGRQRMLSQKAAKDICFLNLGLGGATQRDLLAKTMQEFRTAMDDLLEGAEARNIIKPPNRQIKRQLDRVARAWKDFETLAERLNQEGAIPQAEMVKLSNLSQQVLLEMNLAVVMYAQS